MMMVDFPTPSERNGEERVGGEGRNEVSFVGFFSSSSFPREKQREEKIFTDHLLLVRLSRLFASFKRRLG